jgi:hypothetical protein
MWTGFEFLTLNVELRVRLSARIFLLFTCSPVRLFIYSPFRRPGVFVSVIQTLKNACFGLKNDT